MQLREDVHSPEGVQHSGHSWHSEDQSKAKSSKLAMAAAASRTRPLTPC